LKFWNFLLMFVLWPNSPTMLFGLKKSSLILCFLPFHNEFCFFKFNFPKLHLSQLVQFSSIVKPFQLFYTILAHGKSLVGGNWLLSPRWINDEIVSTIFIVIISSSHKMNPNVHIQNCGTQKESHIVTFKDSNS
jgi:hypothetical protein